MSPSRCVPQATGFSRSFELLVALGPDNLRAAVAVAALCGRQSRAKLENDQEDDIALIAKAAQDAARRKKDQGLAAPFAETIRYNGQIADKAVYTRTKNAEAKAAAEKTRAEKDGASKDPGGQSGG